MYRFTALVPLAAIVLLAALVLGGWQAGWWFRSQDATRQAELTQNGYSNQVTLRQQVTAQFATVETVTAQIAAAGNDTSLITALQAQRAGIAGIVCADAAQISGSPLPLQQAQWAAANCQDGALSSGSTLYQAGQP
jgi:hypothetical protein